ncbi:MAG: rRNA maturation RNase YbeY [Lachnospiraceae bacterium]|nr:rRNA maturation RNase YbeY [Lachnospiraceae bacterium]
MNLYMENETERELPFSVQDTAAKVCQAVLEAENCPYEAQVNIVLTDNEGIRELNRECRNIDRETDVLSFPNVDFEEEGVFDIDEDSEADYFDPETGELVLGDIMISVDKVYEQAQEYGHSLRREFAFLVAHSMLHLCGYDHMEEDERARMERRQEEILTGLGITRD